MWNNPEAVEYFISVMYNYKEDLWPMPRNINGGNKRAIMAQAGRMRRHAWKKVASLINKAHKMNVSLTDCKKRYEYMKRIFMNAHMPSVGMRRVRPWPYLNQFRPVMKYMLSANPVTGHEARLKEILDAQLDVEPPEPDQNQGKGVVTTAGWVGNSHREDQDNSDDVTGSSGSDSSWDDNLHTSKTSNSQTKTRFRKWSTESTEYFLKLLENQKEIIFGRRAEDGKFLHGNCRRARAWRRITVDLNKNKALGVDEWSDQCKMRYEYLRGVFMDLTTPITKRAEKVGRRPRKSTWPHFTQFRRLMKYICEQKYQGASAVGNDQLQRMMQVLNNSSTESDHDDDEGFKFWEPLDDEEDDDDDSDEYDDEVDERAELANADDINSQSEDEEFEFDEEDEGEEIDLDSTSGNLKFESTQAFVNSYKPSEAKAVKAQATPFSIQAKSTRKRQSVGPPLEQVTRLEKVRSWVTTSSESSGPVIVGSAAAAGCMPRTRDPPLPVSKQEHSPSTLASTCTSSSSNTVSMNRKRPATTISSSEASEAQVKKKKVTSTPMRQVGLDSGGSHKTRRGTKTTDPAPLVTSTSTHTPASAVSHSIAKSKEGKDKGNNDLLLEEIRGMRTDIRSLHASLEQILTVQLEFNNNIKKILIKQQNSTNPNRED